MFLFVVYFHRFWHTSCKHAQQHFAHVATFLQPCKHCEPARHSQLAQGGSSSTGSALELLLGVTRVCGQGEFSENAVANVLVVILITCIEAVIAAKQKDDGRITRVGGGTLLARLSKLQASRQRPCPRSTISGSAS